MPSDGEQYVCILLLLQSVCMHGVHMHMRHRAPPKEGGRRCSGVVGRIKKGLLLWCSPRQPPGYMLYSQLALSPPRQINDDFWPAAASHFGSLRKQVVNVCL